jgi:hypothetical protein
MATRKSAPIKLIRTAEPTEGARIVPTRIIDLGNADRFRARGPVNLPQGWLVWRDNRWQREA